jgi:hypothetical protein
MNKKPKGKQVLGVILCKKKDYLTGRAAGEDSAPKAEQPANIPVTGETFRVSKARKVSPKGYLK